MKLTILLLIATIMQVSAGSYAQQVTFTRKNVSLEQVFSEVKKQTGYRILYPDRLIDDSNIIDVDFKNASIDEVLRRCLKNESVTYIVQLNRSIVLKEKEPSFLEVLADKLLDIDINGRVLDEEGRPISAVSVKIKGSNKVIVTGADGRFKLSVPNENTVLVFSFVGYVSKEIRVQQNMTVTLVPELNKLNDLVIVGYGSTRRKDLTGSVASVNVNEVKDVPFMSVDNALAGKAAGVQVVKADGSPGGAVRIRIRGGASLLGTNDPLYVIDGIPTVVTNNYINSQSDIVNPVEAANYGEDFNNSVSGAFSRGLNNLSGLNISDIESIDILKDASATAIYGSKAANGVVIITTKKGKLNSKPQLNVNYYVGVNKPVKEQVLNADQYKSALKEASTNYIAERTRLGLPLTTTAALRALGIINDPAFFGTANTDWVGLVLRTGFTQNADVSVSGGGAGSRYYTSLNYTKQDGTLIGTDFNRISGKINLDNEISQRFRVITNLNYGFTTNNITNGIYGQALTAPPTFSPYNEDGTYASLGLLNTDYRGFQNPLAVASGTNRGKDYSLMGSLSAEYDILNELKFKSTVSANFRAYNQLNYVPSYVEVGGFYGREDTQGGLGSQSNSNFLSTFIENTLTWNKEFNEDHRLTVLAGTSWEKNKSDYFSATGRGYPDDNFLNNLSSAAVPVSVSGANPLSQSSLLSFYVRANYVLMDKYLLTFTGRSDASSKFGPGNQVGYFPSGAVGWRISQENFLKDVKWLDELKLRASAGRTGTQNIGDHLWRTLYTPDAYAGNNALVPSQLGNANIKWESTTQQDLGLDFSFFKGRLGGTFGYYNKVTDGALLNLTPAPSSSYSSVIYNIAKIRNRGLEFELHGDLVRSKVFSWTGAINISRNISRVLNIDGGPFSNPADRNALNLGTSIVKEDEPLGLLYGRVSKGVIKTQEQLEAYKAAFPYYIYFQPMVNVGDMSYEMAEDGFWKQDIIGNAAPEFFGGYTNTLTYRNLSLMTLFTFSYGNELIYQKDVSDMTMSDLPNRGVRVLDHYSAEHPNSERPRYLFSETSFLTDANVYDASYIKLKSISLSYNIPSKWMQRLKINNLSVYGTATNLFTITKYPGPDPEVSDDPGSVIGGGRDVSTYPTTRSYTFGMRLGF
ncbi:TonB-dependent receptor [Pedobacter sp. BAL39]|uniref:TonB-dependent receptor n=1 Tax=Pedobacter sp. BAL39 TaxID=391596 RepID=UPI000587933E|nr:TonB-dependent receptor [Pedobacter sp. BAL39]